MKELRFQSVLWHVVAGIWVAVAAARLLSGDASGATMPMVQFGIAFILGKIFSMRAEISELKDRQQSIKIVCYNNSIGKGERMEDDSE